MKHLFHLCMMSFTSLFFVSSGQPESIKWQASNKEPVIIPASKPKKSETPVTDEAKKDSLTLEMNCRVTEYFKKSQELACVKDSIRKDSIEKSELKR